MFPCGRTMAVINAVTTANDRLRHNGEYLSGMPSNLKVLSGVEVEFETLPGWKEDISKAKNFSQLPANARAYVERVEQLLGVPIRWIGVGAGRDDVVDKFVTRPAAAAADGMNGKEASLAAP
ncbi:unnamed protein product [Phaeothamnion confervicola]